MAENENTLAIEQEEVAEESKRLFDNGQLVEDLIQLFNANMDSNGIEFSNEIKSAVLLDACWALTERKMPIIENRPAPKAKIRGCDYWSKAAFEMAYDFGSGKYCFEDKKECYYLDEKNEWFFDERKGRYLSIKTDSTIKRAKGKDADIVKFDEGKMVVHEHLVPRSVLIKALLNPAPTIKHVADNLKTFLKCFKACVITRNEDRQIASGCNKAMPENSGMENFNEIVGKIKEAKGDEKEEKDIIQKIIWSRYQNSRKLYNSEFYKNYNGFIVYKMEWAAYFTKKTSKWLAKGISEVLRIDSNGCKKIEGKELDEIIENNKLGDIFIR